MKRILQTETMHFVGGDNMTEGINRTGFVGWGRQPIIAVTGRILLALFFVFAMSAASAYAACSDCHNSSHATSLGCSNKMCVDCHSDRNVYHATGTGTPMANGLSQSCVICHAAKPDAAHPTTAVWTDPWGTITGPTFRLSSANQSDLDAACGQCHIRGSAPALNLTQLATAAPGIHAPSVVVSFYWIPDSVVSYKVNFNAIGSVCAAGFTCSYTWDFGDGSPAGSGVTTSHTYGSSAPVTVTLTLASGTAFSVSSSQTVTPTAINQPPLVSRTGADPAMQLTISGWTVSFNDTSSDPDGPLPANAVTISWGDGAIESKNAGLPFSHTYSSAATYIIRHTVTDAGGMMSRWQYTSGPLTGQDARVTVPASTIKYSINGTITDTGAAAVLGATVSLKRNGVTLKSTTTAAGGTYSFTGLDSGTYTVTAALSGYDWQTAAGTQSLSLPVTVTITNSSVIQDFHPAKSPATL